MNKVALVLKGMAMGIAEVIPGVSGGTIAFISGIYERLLKAIRSLDLELIGHLTHARLWKAFKHLDGRFLVFLLMGMAVGIVAGVFGISHLLEHYSEILYAFFFGLILASAWYVGKGVKQWDAASIIAIIAGAGIAFVITQVSPAQGVIHPLYIGLSGFLAISALMLPGISGSFILLLLGMYTVVIGTLKNILSGDLAGWWILLCFIGGMVIGLLVFSRVLTWMFRHYHEVTLALLAGFMLGSLPKIWPWRVPVKWLDGNGIMQTTGVPGHDARILSESTVLPEQYSVGDPDTALAICASLLGVAVILAATVIEKRLKSSNSQMA
jgi:putative membrane protein